MENLQGSGLETKIKILSTGKYSPKRTVLSTEIDKKLNMPLGWTEKLSGVVSRQYADVRRGESVAEMAALAAKNAIENAGMKVSDIDCVVSACGVMQQFIPCTASIIHKHLGLTGSSVPAFDINSTCLSFVTAIDMLSHLVEGGKYRNMLIVSSDVASIGLDEKNPECLTIFGDGAAAAILSRPEEGEDCGIIASQFETYSEGNEMCQIKVGTSHHPRLEPDQVLENSVFKMNGPEIFKLVGEKFPDFVKRLLHKAKLTLQDIKLLIPHQASNLGMDYVRHILQLSHEKLMDIYSNHGNQVATSIPTALHEAIAQKRIVRNDTILLIGSSAGLALGGIILKY